MTFKNSIQTTTALVLSASVAFSALPVSQASAHEPHRGYHQHVGDYGYGGYGDEYYAPKRHHKQKRHYKKHRKSRDKGDVIAAGIIGLALGAVIVGSIANSKKQKSYSAPAYAPDPYSGVSQQGGYVGLDDYGQSNNTVYSQNRAVSGPEVINYYDPGSLEPWSPGWKSWCANRFRSFNANTGTYRGYDGRDHFCVPK